MIKTFTKVKRITTLFAGISIVAIPAVGQADWSIMGLGTLGGGYSQAAAINDLGQVVGVSYINDDVYHAFITGPNGMGMTDIHNVASSGSGYSVATDINDSGQVAGRVEGDYGFVTGPNGVGMTKLDAPSEGSISVYGINNSGQVVGAFYTSDEPHAFITGPNGVGLTKLEEGTINWDFSQATAINDSGQAVGFTGYSGFITGPGGKGATALPYSEITDINESGQVVGAVWDTHFGEYLAYVTGPNGVGITNLGTFGGNGSYVNGINDLGEIVGVASTAVGLNNNHAFLFSHGGMTDLSLLDIVVAAGWTNLWVTDINNNGQMVGNGVNSSGEAQAFLLSYTSDTVFDPQPIFIPSPIPEPETYAMLLVGLGLIGFMARRRKAADA